MKTNNLKTQALQSIRYTVFVYLLIAGAKVYLLHGAWANQRRLRANILYRARCDITTVLYLR